MIRSVTAGWTVPSLHTSNFPADGRTAAALLQRVQYGRGEQHVLETTPATNVDRWVAQVPDEFRFSLKLSRAITHERHLENARDPLERFSEMATRFGR